jgi:digeranylgeranylglycerophospholipid reductase
VKNNIGTGRFIMEEIKCDVLIVGAGPSGSSAAWSSAKEGLKTVLIDMKQIPSKDACAETLSKAFLEYLPFKIPGKFLKWKLDGLEFNYKNFHIIKNDDIWWKSYPLNRNEFDPFVLDLAIKQGADYLPLTRFINLKYDKNIKVKEVAIKNLKNNKITKIKPKILIGADGVQSNVLKSIGKIKKQKTAIGYIKSYEFHNLSLKSPHNGHVFFGEFADGAYGYIFPKSETSANIGIATLGSQNNDAKFKKFLEIIKDQVKGSKKFVDRSGKAPIKNPSDKIVYGNIMFTGDAANQNFKPFVEGIQPGIICGAIAGKAANENILNNKKLEDTYKNMIKEKIGKLFVESDVISSVLVSSYENRSKARFLLEFGMFSYILDYQDLKKIEKLRYKEIELFIKEKLKI